MRKGALLLLNSLGFGTKKLNSLMESLAAPEGIFTVSEKDLLRAELLTHADRQAILRGRDSDFLKKELRLIGDEGVQILDYQDPGYPSLLREVSGRPIVLYVKGNAAVLNKISFAIVGTRVPTLYGISMAQEYASRLSALGLVIASGLARGIDTAAHRAALVHGETIAVLGSGLGSIYPKENSVLARAISDKGAIVSEFAITTPPRQENFPRRNRIISGISKGVLVVEAAARSGALITAHYALEQNREVFALPGNADSPLSKGAHALIKEGAKLVDCIEDILQELNIKFEALAPAEAAVTPALDADENSIYGLITPDGVGIEEILARSRCTQALVSKVVLDLQLKGLIKEVRPSCFAKLSY